MRTLRQSRWLIGLLVVGPVLLAGCSPTALKVSNAELGAKGHTLLMHAYAEDRREVYTTEDEKVTFAVRLGYNVVGYFTRFRVHWIAPTGATYLDARARTAWGSHQALIAELPIRGQPAARLVGQWRVRLLQGERILTERRFELVDARYVTLAEALEQRRGGASPDAGADEAAEVAEPAAEDIGETGRILWGSPGARDAARPDDAGLADEGATSSPQDSTLEAEPAPLEAAETAALEAEALDDDAAEALGDDAVEALDDDAVEALDDDAVEATPERDVNNQTQAGPLAVPTVFGPAARQSCSQPGWPAGHCVDASLEE